MEYKLVAGTIKNNCNEEYVKELEGIKILSMKFQHLGWTILGGINDIEHEKLMKVLYEQSGDFLGYESLNEFKKMWTEETVDGGFYIQNENLIDIEDVEKTDVKS